MTLEDVLRSAARDVADTAPDTYLAPSEIRSRARAARRRQRVGAAAGLVAATAVVAVGLQVVGGGTEDAHEPIQPAPSPTPDANTAPGVPVVEVPKISPDDLREYKELRTITNTQPGNEGLTELTFEVPVSDLYSYEWDAFCSGDRDTWYVIVVGNRGASGSGYCDSPASEPFPTFPADISPAGHSGGAAATQEVRMLVVDEIPPKHQKCFDEKSPSECQDLTPPLVPLSSTDVTFGISVYEYWAPPVVEVLGHDLAARASVGGTDYLLSQVLTPGDGQSSFTTTMPAGGDRIVAVLERFTDAGVACAREAEPDRDAVQECLYPLALRIGDRTRPLERAAFGDYPWSELRAFDVPGDRDQEVELGVTSGDVENVEFALVVFEETS